MKKILLASVALTAFAGAAAAEVSFSGDATVGYNDTDSTGTGDNNFGYYGTIGLSVGMSAELDNGITVSVAADIDEVEADFTGLNATVTVSSANGSLVYGDTTFAGEDLFADTGSTALAVDEQGDTDEVLKGTVIFGSVTAAVSYEITGTDDETLDNQNVAVSADMGGVTVTAVYEEATGLTGFSAAGSFGGADVSFSTLSNDADDSSTGIGVSYPMGAVTISASYSVEEDAGVSVDDNWDVEVAYAEGAASVAAYTDESDAWGFEAGYDMGNGLAIEAGIVDAGDTTYFAANYDLGGGASLLASFVDTDAVNNDDEYGPSDLQEGTTIELSFAF